MPDLTRLSILVPLPMMGRPERAAINAHVRAEFDVVANNHGLRSAALAVKAVVRHITECRANHRPGVDADAVAEFAARIKV